MKKIVVGIVIALFLFTRLYKLDQSFFFYNEMGREMWFLSLWKESGKPPVLGPQTSALPFNQSPWYYYILYPGYLLYNQPVVLVYSCLVFYLICFLLAVKISGKNWWLPVFLFTALGLHYQVLIQNRYIWNPSFVPPLLVLGTVAIMRYLEDARKKPFDKAQGKYLGLGIFSLILGMGMSYSSFPYVAVVLLLIYLYSRKIKEIGKSLVASMVVVFAPIALFEVKYHFLLSKAVLRQGREPQNALGLVDKLTFINANLFFANNLGYVIMVLVLIFSLFVLLRLKDRKQRFVAWLFVLHSILFLVVPFQLQPHLMFGFLVSLLLVVGIMPKVGQILFLIFSMFLLWQNWPSITTKAPRSVEDMQQCFAPVCKDLGSKSVFVSTQAGFHLFHTGFEDRYLLYKAGCKVLDIEKDKNASSTMLVVEDGAKYEDGKTDYYELGLFGKHKETKRYSCGENLGVVVVEKR